WEWCQDWYGGYSSSPQIDPTGPVSGTYRVVRGGGWDYGAGSCRSAFRYYGNPGGGVSGGGFRLSRTK
ncbi:MAG TPA: SUMF1/EgtB/PvdO family nonheme iron enzyme, partial [bacterium]|nr:SUMF1/EgtB/PvdO family nonheme iron enzyme [bacterium]